MKIDELIDLILREGKSILSSLNSDFLLVVTFCLIYFFLFVFVRWNFIAKPCRQHLYSQIEKLKIRIREEQKEKLNKASEIAKFSVEKKEIDAISLWEKIFWSRGHEIAAWEIVHDVEAQIQPHKNEIDAELIACKAELTTLKTAEAKIYLTDYSILL